MKIAVTGHSSGIGKACLNTLRCTVSSGYSRRNGWNISDSDTLIQELVTKNYDIVINNAYQETHQSDILEKLFHVWREKPKVIISIGSYVIDYPRIQSSDSGAWPYRDHKKHLANLFRKLAKLESKCRLGLINPGPVDTKMIAHLDVPKLSAIKVAETVQLMIDNAHIKEVTLYD